jgi:cyclic lactone autoinducer peptide
MKVKEKIAEVVAKMALSFAKEAAGAASMYSFYQPEEPKNLSERLAAISANRRKD